MKRTINKNINVLVSVDEYEMIRAAAKATGILQRDAWKAVFYYGLDNFIKQIKKSQEDEKNSR